MGRMSLPDSRWNCGPTRTPPRTRSPASSGSSRHRGDAGAARLRDTPDAPAASSRPTSATTRPGSTGIDAACDWCSDHVARGSRILVHGDYDVDGVASTAILVRALRVLGADPALAPAEPLRGGLRARPLVGRADGRRRRRPADHGRLRDHRGRGGRARALARRRRDRDRPPPAGRHACPTARSCTRWSRATRSPTCARRAWPTSSSQALYARAGRDPARADEDLDLVAHGDGRRPRAAARREPAARGRGRRARSARTAKPGLRALMKIASVDPARVDAGAIGYRLAPRINAAGRLQRADAALELLLTEDETRAGRGGRRARPAEPRAPGHGDAAAVRGRGRARRAAGGRARLRARGRGLAPRRRSGSWPRGSWSATTGPSC